MPNAAHVDTDGGVVVINPAKQHAYEVAVALQRAGCLRQFVTGAYYKPAAFPYTAVGWLPPAVRNRVGRELEKRRHRELAPDLVRSWPYAEALSRSIGSAGWIVRLSRGNSGGPFIARATDWYAARAIARMQPRPRAVYGFHNSALRTFVQARRLTIPTVLDVPIVLDAYQTIEREHRALGLTGPILPRPLPTVRAEVELADWAVVGAPAVAASVRRTGFAGNEIFVVPYGADTSVFKPRARTGRAPRFRAVFAGRVDARKGVHYLLDAWRQAGLDGELLLAGPVGEPQFVARMQREYGGLFTETGPLAQPALAELLSGADIFIFPSLAEGSALVTYEALASGVPCIVTAEAGSVVRDGVEGFVVPARDARAIRERLDLLYHDPGLRERMARAALARGTEFGWSRYHRELASVIERVLEHTGERRAGAQER